MPKRKPGLAEAIKMQKSLPSPHPEEILGSQRWARKGAARALGQGRACCLVRAWLPERQKALESRSLPCSAEHSRPLSIDLNCHVQRTQMKEQVQVVAFRSTGRPLVSISSPAPLRGWPWQPPKPASSNFFCNLWILSENIRRVIFLQSRDQTCTFSPQNGTEMAHEMGCNIHLLVHSHLNAQAGWRMFVLCLWG